MLENATQYILALLTENEEVKKLPAAFVSEAAKWVKSWFFKPEDPRLATKLEDPNRTTESKKTLIESKLEDLESDAQFQQELAERLAAYTQQRASLKNVVVDADIDVAGNVHIGDTGSASGDGYAEKNVIKGSSIKAGGDFRVGDDVISGNQTVNIHHHYGSDKRQENTPPPASTASELKSLLAKAKTEAVIERLLALSETRDTELHNSALLLSGRLMRVNKQERDGIISHSEANIVRNQINAALTSLIDALTA